MLSRRELLLSGAALLFACGRGRAKAQASGRLLLLGELEGTRACLEQRDLGSGARRVVELGIERPHSLTRHGDRILVLPQFAAAACVVHAQTLAVEQRLECTQGNVFYGHGVFSHDGATLYTVESSADLTSAIVVVRDGRSLASLGTFPAHGRTPHDLRFLDGGSVLAVVDSGGPLRFARARQTYPEADEQRPTTVNFVEVKSGKLLERVAMPMGLSTAHLVLTDDGEVLVGLGVERGQPAPATLPAFGLGAISHGVVRQATTAAAGLGARELDLARRSVGFSLAVDDRRHRVAVTHPDERAVSVFDYAESRLLAVHVLSADGGEPRGCALAAGGEAYLIGTETGRLYRLDAATLELTLLDADGDNRYVGHSLMLEA